jgi:cob(I)alamin adenosyltransferase
MKVYTKTGDKGTTGLVNGKRVSKSNHRIEAYGTVDELNSTLAVAVSSLKDKDNLEDLRDELLDIQHRLFDLGANLACESAYRNKYKLPKITSSIVSALEKSIDKMSGEVGPLESFILPGGSIEASYLHISRTVCRRIERLMVKSNELADIDEGISEASFLEFINRLSDYLFTAARYVNFKLGISEIKYRSSK